LQNDTVTLSPGQHHQSQYPVPTPHTTSRLSSDQLATFSVGEVETSVDIHITLTTPGIETRFVFAHHETVLATTSSTQKTVSTATPIDYTNLDTSTSLHDIQIEEQFERMEGSNT
jgi:hypothetical protein